MTVMKASDLLKAADIHANRPAANVVPTGALYSCTTHNLIYRSDGSTWATWATLTPATPTAAERFVLNRTGVTDYTTVSTTFADIDATNLTATVTTPTGGKRYMVTLQARVSHSVANGLAVFDFMIDAARAVSASTTGSGVRLISIVSTGTSWEVSIVYITSVLAAGSHTIKPQWRTNSGTLTMKATTDELVQFSVVEL